MIVPETKPCRRPLVYGKARISASTTYGVFEVEEIPADDGKHGGSRPKHKETSKTERQQQQQIRDHVGPSIKGTPPMGLGKTRRPGFSGQTLGSSRASAREESNPEQHHPGDGVSTYDVPLSEDEEEEEEGTRLVERSMQKRRKLTPVKKSGSSSRRAGNADAQSDSSHRSQNLKARTPTPRQRRKAEEVSTKKPRSRPRIPKPETAGGAVPASVYVTPKQARIPSKHLDPATSFDSPSRLPLTSLKLAPTEISTPKMCRPDISPFRHLNQLQTSSPPPKRRLIDAMASPGKPFSISESEGSDSELSVSGAEKPFSEPLDPIDESQQATATNVNSLPGRSESSQESFNNSSTSLSAAFKSKSTYSRERSHLAEMVSEDLLDPLSDAASGRDGSSMSQNSTFLPSLHTSLPQGGMQEDDDDQDISGIRSIHELRQSGSNARSRVDIESLLDDIESKGASSRARRLHGLTQLAARLGGANIGPQILEHSIDQRLLRCPLPDEDTIGQTLLTMVFSRLLVSIQLPSASLKKGFRALIGFGVNLVGQSRKLTLIARDRQQNLSRATSKGILELIRPYCSSTVWLRQKPTALSPQLIFVKCLDLVLRQARQLGDFDMVLPASIFGPLVQLLLRSKGTLAQDNKENDSSTLMMGLAVSVIESSTISKCWAQADCLEIAGQLSDLGPLLNLLALSGPESSNGTPLLILRLILNITNNSSDLCDGFTNPDMLSAIFGIIHRDFIQTSPLADVALEESRLEAVILALGTLSNLAEHSHVFRQAMLDSTFEGKKMVDWLALAFREQVKQVSEISSVEQSTSLVAFGYLSVLLCNLCLETQIRAHVRGFLQGKTLEPLLSFTQEFLGHFRKAEELESGQEAKSEEFVGKAEEEQSMQSNFVDRFDGVLTVLRQAEAQG